MPEVPAICNQIDTILTTPVTTPWGEMTPAQIFNALQQRYLSDRENNGRAIYCQMVRRMLNQIPDDETADMDVAPGDQPNVSQRVKERLVRFLRRFRGALTAFQCNVYEGPEGVGYVVILVVSVSGDIWYRSINVGPENRRGHGWILYEEEA